jgi:8-oxo-dGTP pyrophosphatase MutT (NUDIX family)
VAERITDEQLRLDVIRARLREHRPVLAALPGSTDALRAAVTLILHEPAERPPELLFIERARSEGDPWSGHMAFPGGRRDPGDPDIQATAAREAYEEVGITLGAPIGRLDDFSGNRNPRLPALIVSPFVYEVSERPKLLSNHEVQSTVWIPVSWILAPDSAVEYRVDQEGRGGPFPAFRYRGYIVWGLTYRILRSFFAALGREFGTEDV